MKPDLGALAVHFTPTVTRLIAAGLGILILGWAGVKSSRAGFARRAELRQADSTLAVFADWQRRFQPAVAAESIAWRRTWMEVRDLGIVGDERLALMQAVARAAEFAGLEGVRVLIDKADTTGSDARLSTEGVRRQSAPFGLLVECRGNLRAMVAFLGTLPPAVAPTSVSLVRQDGRARHRITLAVYELEFANAPVPHIIAAPLERGAAGRGDGDRSGG